MTDDQFATVAGYPVPDRTRRTLLYPFGDKSGHFKKLFVEYIRQMQDVVVRNRRSSDRDPQIVRASLTDRELFVVDSFERLGEITGAKDRIYQIRSLARLAPPRHLDMDRMEYLRFFVEAYYQELYIMELRIERWIVWHERRIKRSDADKLTCKRMRDIVREGFNGTRKVRAAHVHDRRHSTEELNWAASLSLIARTVEPNDPESEMWELAAKLKYRESRKKFIERIDADLQGIGKMLDVLSEYMSPIVMAQFS